MNAAWLRYLPLFIRRKLIDRHTLQAVVTNISWLLADNVLRMVLGVLVGAWVARYLGPEQFGELAYILAFVVFFQVIGKLGLDSIVIREIAHDPDSAPIILGTVFRLRLIAGMACWFAAIGGIALLRPGDSRAMILVAIVAGTIVFQAADTVDLWFQSRTQSKRTVLAKTSIVLITSLIRVALILVNASLEAFAVAMLIEAALLAFALLVAYKRYPTPVIWIWKSDQARRLLMESWPFLLSGVSILIYMRIDQLMLREMVGAHELGIYSAALPLSTAWYFIPTAICASVAPALARKKARSETEYIIALERLFGLMWWYSLPLCVAIALLSKPIIDLIYGFAYSASSEVLALHIFSNVPVAIGVAQGQWTVNEKRIVFALYRTLCGATINVLMNLLLIPFLGAIGAALASILAQFFSVVFLNFFLAPCILKMQFRGGIGCNFFEKKFK